MNTKELKRKLKSMQKSDLRILFQKAELNDTEKWLLIYAYIDERMVQNICAKLSLSESTYFRMLPIALTKIYYTLKFA